MGTKKLKPKESRGPNMAKAFTTYTRICGKEPMLRRIVFELRYQDGQLYLDHCGRLLKRLLKASTEWVVASEPTSQAASLYNVTTGTQLGFSSSSASLLIDKTVSDELIDAEEVATFLEQVDPVLGMVLDELEVSEFLRIGFRQHFYFPCDTQEESEQWIRNLGVVAVSSNVAQAFAGSLEDLGFAITLQGEECRYRIALNSIERSAQVPVGDTVLSIRTSGIPRGQKKALVDALKKKRQRQINSAFAVLLDMDAYLLEPVEPNLQDFVQERVENNLKKFADALPKKGK
jgi:hypothetical protein